MANKTSQHILSTSANLLGFCLIVITSLHLSNRTENNYIDEATSILALFLAVSSLFSFASIRTDDERREFRLEKIADTLFAISLVGIFGIVAFIIVNYWNM
jgi:hypothetical protein